MSDGAPPSPESRPTGVVAALTRADDLVGKIEQGLVAFFLAALIGIGAFQAVIGNLTGYKPDGADEYLRYMVFFVAMSGAALAAQSKKLIAMDVLSRILPPRTRLLSRIVTALFSIAVCSWLALAAYELRSSALASERGPGFLTQYDVMLALPLACWLIVFHLAVGIAINVEHLVRGTTPPEDIPSGH